MVASPASTSSISMSSSVSMSCTVDRFVRLKPSEPNRCERKPPIEPDRGWKPCWVWVAGSPWFCDWPGAMPTLEMPLAPGRPLGMACGVRDGGAPACTSSKCCRRSCSEASVRPQQAKSFMKLASSLGRYEDEWYEGDWLLKAAGEVPAIMMLMGVLTDGWCLAWR